MPPRSSLTLLVVALVACEPADDTPTGPLPNLTPLLRLPLLQERTFSADACEVQERCVAAGGARRLLRFDLATSNIGTADVDIGPPTTDGGLRPGFEYAPCHDHFHLTGYADFRLFTMDGREVGRGHKQAFCLEDTDHAPGFPPRIVADRDRFTCLRQGIHVGWMDLYTRNLACQYVDVTDVAPGRYRLRASVNVSRYIRESRYDDNTTELLVDIPPRTQDDAGVDAGDGGDAAVIDPTLPCAMIEQGEHRDCGWEAESAARHCAPGAAITVACDALCGTALGSCMGDAMLRVCEGERPCLDREALASNDDACAGDAARNPCPRVRFTCPPSGSYRVLTAAYRAGLAYQCRVAAE